MGEHNFMAMPLGDYEVILGNDFLRKYCFIPFPYLDGVMIMNEANLIFIKVIYPYGKVKKVKSKTSIIFTILIEKGLKKGDETFLAAMIEVKLDVTVKQLDCII